MQINTLSETCTLLRTSIESGDASLGFVWNRLRNIDLHQNTKQNHSFLRTSMALLCTSIECARNHYENRSVMSTLQVTKNTVDLLLFDAHIWQTLQNQWLLTYIYGKLTKTNTFVTYMYGRHSEPMIFEIHQRKASSNHCCCWCTPLENK